MDNGNAYEVNGNVYFDVASDPDYGKLSGRKMEESKSGTRVETAGDKKNPSDFALWKKAEASHIMKWSSPWGDGYPGWHVECSAMSTKYLGETFDIHGGGLENQFPHHECEIAQSECAHHKDFVRYWMHNNMVTLNGQKMGKSLGNAIALHQFYNGDHPLLTRPWPPLVIRFFLLQSHYRSTTDFSEKALEAAENGLKNLHGIIHVIMEGKAGKGDAFNLESLRKEVESCLNDDFNTAQAIGVLFDKLRPLRTQVSDGQAPVNLEEVQQFLVTIIDHVLGLWPVEESKNIDDNVVDSLVHILIDMRNQARNEKNWALADLIRDRLKSANIILEDTPEGTIYRLES